MSVSASDWIKGISLSILASVIGGVSKLAIRKSWLTEAGLEEAESRVEARILVADHALSDEEGHIANEKQREADFSSATKQRALCLRIAGMIGMTILNPACCVLAMNYASPSILAPFSGVTLVWIVLFSPIFVDEQPTRIQINAASLIILGEGIVALFGDHTNDEGHTLADLTASYKEPGLIAYFLGVILWMVLIVYWIKYSTSPFVKRFAWGVAGGSIAGAQNFLKDSLTILKANEGYPWYLPVMMALAMVTAFTGLLLLTACMKRYDATYSSAMYVGSFIVSASIMSALHYHTFAHLNSAVNYIMYPAGILILMTGVLMLINEKKEGNGLTPVSSANRDLPITSESEEDEARLGSLS